ncbi:MAG TPA: M28 family peptidase [Candidatus Deferrimicrobium sp.]|nr:M28 family peptidase [Candidatus Deferrimicrobium sp.]
MTSEEEKQVTEYMHFIIQEICDTIGPRPPCSPEEAKCASYIEDHLKENANETAIEEFFCHPGSYRAQFEIPVVSLISITIFYWFYFYFQSIIFLILPLCILTASLLVIFTNIMRNIEFIDPVFKNEPSTNVFGKFKPKDAIKRRIVIGGHHDSNWEYPILRKSWKLLGFLMAFPVILNYLFFAIFIIKLLLHFFSIYYLFISSVDLALLIFLTILIPVLIFWAFNIVSDRPIMGANDNLTSIAVILAIASRLKSLDLKSTEVWLVSHGCEEIGDRGSKRFSQKYYPELKDAFIINIDMIGGKNTQLRFITAEVIFLVKLSQGIATELAAIAQELNIPYQMGMIEAFTDSMAYAQNKIRACSIIGFTEKGIPAHYHTREDTIEKLDFRNLWDCYQILLKFIKKVDNGEILQKIE